MDPAEQTNVRLSTDEIGDVIKSQKNLIYLFKLSGLITRVLPASEGHVHVDIFEGRPFGKKEADQSLQYTPKARHS